MSDHLIEQPDAPACPVWLVKLSKWCELTGDTADAVHSRRKRLEWREGVHWHLRGAHVWIDTVEAQKWVRGEQKLKSAA